MNPILTAEAIRHRYGEEEILKGVDFSCQEGEFVAITGESGSGKTTLLSVISTFLRPTNGTLWFQEMKFEDIANIDLFRREHIGFVFQFHYLINYLNVEENIVLAALPSFRHSVDELLEILHISALRSRYPDEISGGERQRVAIARALINQPKIVFADEPTGNLDTFNSLEVYKLFRRFKERGTAFVVATHDTTLASYADRKIEMQDGYIKNVSL